MHKIDGDGNVAGEFTEGNPGAGQVATQVTDDWLNTIQRELVNVATANGAALNKANDGQVLGAMDARFGRLTTANTWTGGGAVHVLKAGASMDHVYVSFYARSAAQGTRSAFFGFGGAASTSLEIVNELANGDVRIAPGPGVGSRVRIDGPLAVARFTDIGETLVTGLEASLNNVGTFGQALVLKPGSSNHAFIGFYARSSTPAAISATLGYATAGATSFDIKNEIASGDIRVLPGAGGKVQVGGNLAFTGVANPAQSTAITNTITPLSVAKVWARIRTDGSGGVFIDDAYNLSSVSIIAVSVPFVGNVVRVTFASSFSNTTFSAAVTSCDVASLDLTYRAGHTATTHLNVVYSNGNNTTHKDPATTSGSFMLQVFGRQ
ncbi:hypothetical protein MYSTI_01916 [Myxococcus stipitatus DSM 14675]|uniref:Uncharacterized protein n=1 Tax=Myxococcus stipitatus (strain DSM 14675 / JCM 12634 / Mx s8) TaxID=1278073 RepID=L7U6N0_MYXSD|nr:hypothetical protein [Myxococcus stipitatus]AGC43247.1 hypothetical protein MYSTI_01916 [Myxococcus stipitatus DSM 14675]